MYFFDIYQTHRFFAGKSTIMSMFSKLILLLAFIMASVFSRAQLTGVKNIPGDYATIGAAITALNTSGVGSGGVTFNVAAGHTETITGSGYSITTTTSSLSNPVVFQKSGIGANPRISTAVTGSGTVSPATYGANGDAIIRIVCSDFITFDGIDLAEAYTGTSGSLFTEYGFLLNKTTTDACKNIVIKNGVITMSRARVYSIAIYQSNMNSSGTNQAVSAASGCAASNSYSGNTLTAYHGIRCNGYSGSFPDTDTQIGVSSGNSFIAFGGLSSSQNVYAIDCNYQENCTIAGNTINGGSGTTNSASPWPTIYGINFAGGNDYPTTTISNNIITINVGTGEASITGINVSGGGYLLGPVHNTTVTISNNEISSCRTNTIYQTFSGIVQSAAYDFVNIHHNSITNNTCGHIGSLINNSNNASGFDAQVSVYNNTVTGNASTYNSTSPASSYLLRMQSVGTALLKVYENTLGDNTSLMDYMYCLWVTSGSSSPAEARVYRNTIRNVSASGSTAYCYGLYVSSGISTQIYNNFIADLKAPTASNTNAITGIYITSSATSVNLLHNSVAFAASSTGTNFGTYAVYANTSPTINIINNILSNSSVPRGTGKTVAYGRSSTTLSSYGASSNNNLFFAGSPSAANLVFTDGTNNDQTLAAFQARVSTRDMNSISTDPTGFFTSAVDLHLGNCSGCAVENAGVLLASVSDDIDSEVRNDPPEIGADEKSNPLPVNLLYFDARCIDDHTELTWKTSSETNNAYFLLERSNGNSAWSLIATIAGAGNSNQVIPYSWNDYTLADGFNYYRLTQVDFDGRSRTYGIREIFYNKSGVGKELNCNIYPNPSAGIVYFFSEADAQFEIADGTGRVVLSGTCNAGVEKPVPGLSTGFYVVRLYSDSSESTIKLIIQ